MKLISTFPAVAMVCSQMAACSPLGHSNAANRSSDNSAHVKPSVAPPPPAFPNSSEETHPELLPAIATPEQMAALDAEISVAIQNSGTNNCAELSDDGLSNCPVASLEFKPAPALASSEGNRILYLENRTAPITALTANKNRVLGFYRPSTTVPVRYEAWFPKARVTKIGKLVMSDIVGEKPFHVPVEALSKIAEKKIGKVFKYQMTDGTNISQFMFHGSDIFELLADLNPQAQFVFAETPKDPPGTECDWDSDESLSKIADAYNHSFLNLLKIIREHKINFIHVAWIVNPDTVVQYYSRACKVRREANDPAVLRYVEIVTDYFEKLGSIPGVTLVRGSPNDNHHVLDPSNPVDMAECTEMKNGIRVGFIQVPESGIGPDGDNKPELLMPIQRNALACTDVYVSGGFDHVFQSGGEDLYGTYIFGPRPLMVRREGYRYYPEYLMATSLATPLTLSYLIHRANQIHRNTGRFPTPAELKEIVNDRGHRPMIDPLLYDQFELYTGFKH